MAAGARDPRASGVCLTRGRSLSSGAGICAKPRTGLVAPSRFRRRQTLPWILRRWRFAAAHGRVPGFLIELAIAIVTRRYSPYAPQILGGVVAMSVTCSLSCRRQGLLPFLNRHSKNYCITQT